MTRRNRKLDSALYDADASEKLKTAAEAAGLTVDQLINLVSDSGHMAKLPGGDGITEIVTLGDLGDRLHKLAVAQPRSKRAAWFSGLLPVQQAALVVILRERGHASHAIAQSFDIAQSKVIQLFNKHADSLGANVVNTRLSTIAGNLQIAMERAAQGAMESEDWSTYWRIHKEFTMILQSLGIVDRAAQKIEIDQKVSIGVEEKQEEIKRILAIARAADKRRIEIETAQRDKTDDSDIREEAYPVDRPVDG